MIPLLKHQGRFKLLKKGRQILEVDTNPIQCFHPLLFSSNHYYYPKKEITGIGSKYEKEYRRWELHNAVQTGLHSKRHLQRLNML